MSLTVDSGQTLQRCLALDIGGTKIASAIVKNGEIQQRKQISTPQDDAAQAMHQTLAQLVKEYLPVRNKVYPQTVQKLC